MTMGSKAIHRDSGHVLHIFRVNAKGYTANNQMLCRDVSHVYILPALCMMWGLLLCPQFVLASGSDLGTELVQAAEYGNLERVREIIENAESSGQWKSHGPEALIVAARSSYMRHRNPACLEIMKLLIKNGVDVNSSRSNGKTALIAASSANSISGVRLLLENGALVNLKDKWDFTALTWAAYNGTRNSRKPLIDLLKKNGAEISLVTAVLLNDLEAAKHAIDEGADVNEHIPWRGTLLQVAAARNPAGIAQLLLKNGARVDGQPYGTGTPLLHAASGCWMEGVKVLLAHGADINARARNSGVTPLIAGCRHRVFHDSRLDEYCMRMVEFLLDNGADIDAEDKRGWNALMWAAHKGHLKIVKLLLERGSSRKFSALQVSGRNTEVLTAILKSLW